MILVKKIPWQKPEVGLLTQWPFYRIFELALKLIWALLEKVQSFLDILLAWFVSDSLWTSNWLVGNQCQTRCNYCFLLRIWTFNFDSVKSFFGDVLQQRVVRELKCDKIVRICCFFVLFWQFGGFTRIFFSLLNNL